MEGQHVQAHRNILFADHRVAPTVLSGVVLHPDPDLQSPTDARDDLVQTIEVT